MQQSLSVISYNIHKGFSQVSRQFVLSTIRDALRAVESDFLLLQEVVGQNIKSGKRVPSWPTTSQFEYLADTVWHHFAYGKNAVYDEGHHGNAILSKYPIRSWKNYDISTNPFEQRGVLHVEVELLPSDRILHCMCVHMGLTGKGRASQIAKMIELIKEQVPDNALFILAGDFNDWSKKASRQLEKELELSEVFQELFGNYARTYPSLLPVLQLDRFYVRGLKPVHAEVLKSREWKALSDHLPLLGRLEF